MNRARASISAALSDVEANPYRSLIEKDEKGEALAVIKRIEAVILAKGIDGDRKWTPRQARG